MLKPLLIKSLNAIARSISFERIRHFAGQKFLAPFYHTVSATPLPHIQHLYPVKTPAQFEADLDFLLKYFKPVSLEKLCELVQADRLQDDTHFFLSFDDGLRECAEIIAPILLKKGVPATFFLNPDFIDNKGLMFRYKASLLVDENLKRQFTSAEKSRIEEITARAGVPEKAFSSRMLNVTYQQMHVLDEVAEIIGVDFSNYLEKEQPYMSSGQIRDLIQNGFSVGAHSLDHPEYRLISDEEQIRQTRESAKRIIQKFEMPIKTFAFPFTDFGVRANFFSKVLEGPDALHLTFGSAGLKQDVQPQHIHRLPMEGTILPAQDIVATELLYYMMKSPFGKNRIKRD